MIDLRHGEALRALAELPDASVDAVITDPPYSSGGMMRSDRSASPSTKYVQSGAVLVGPDFSGDNRDQRSYAHWSALWMSECLRATKRGGVCCVFTDWRQLPTTTDAVQAGGWVWRGLFVWGKNAGRPYRGGFRNQAEYVVWGSKGPLAGHDVYLPGLVTTSVVRGADKRHITAKPVDLMRELVKVAPPGGVVLDPFMGSGSTGVACQLEGRRFIGIEQEQAYVDIARDRLAA